MRANGGTGVFGRSTSASASDSCAAKPRRCIESAERPRLIVAQLEPDGVVVRRERETHRSQRNRAVAGRDVGLGDLAFGDTVGGGGEAAGAVGRVVDGVAVDALEDGEGAVGFDAQARAVGGPVAGEGAEGERWGAAGLRG